MKKKIFTRRLMVLESDNETIHFELKHYVVYLLFYIIPIRIKHIKTEIYYGSYASIKNRTKEVYNEFINGSL